MDIELWFSRRCVRFIKMDMNSSNIVVKTITNMGIYGLHSVIGANKKCLQSQLYMEEMNMYEMWKQRLIVRVMRYQLVYKLENCVSGEITVIVFS